MTKYCVPTSTLSLDVQPPKQHRAQGTKSQKTNQRARRGHKLDKAKAAVKEAAKRVHKTQKWTEPCIAYVGNIGPDVDEDALIAHFSSCGKILSVRIHCCGGVAMTVKPPPETYHRNMRVRQYAIITFESKLARQHACKLDSTLAGRKLTVSLSVSDLPEVREKVAKRLEDYRSRMEPPDPRRAQKSALRSLKLDPTEQLDHRHERDQRLRKRRMVFGLSIVDTVL